MSTQLHFMAEMEDDMEELLQEIEQARQESEDGRWREFPGLFINPLDPPPRIALDVLQEIPRSDITYTQLSTNLICHQVYPNVKLLEFRTFSGAMAYQPCCKDIDLMGFFKPLRPIEPGVDRLFKVARAWSCIIQSIEGLPKDLRWVLATIYNFANDMLCTELSDDTMWRMRPWLMYWYDVADALLELFNVSASAPIPDWFLRPSADADEEYESEVEAKLTVCRTNSVSSDSNQTVLRHCTLGREIQRVGDTSAGRQSGISAWIDAQPDWGAERLYVKPSSGGSLWGNRNVSTSPPSTRSGVSGEAIFQFNPEAMEFDPHPNLATSPASVSSRSPSTWSSEPTTALADDKSTTGASGFSATTHSSDSLEQLSASLGVETPSFVGR